MQTELERMDSEKSNLPVTSDFIEVCLFVLTYSQQASFLLLTCCYLVINQIHAFHLFLIHKLYINHNIVHKVEGITCTS